MTTPSLSFQFPLRVGMVFVSSTTLSEEILQRLSDPAEFVRQKNRLPQEIAEAVEAIVAARVGARVIFRFSERAGCEDCPCSPGFLIYSEETEAARTIANRRDPYRRLVFWAEALADGGWRLEGRDRNEDFVDAVLPPAPAASGGAGELKN
jgi:hypothetical protein